MEQLPSLLLLPADMWGLVMSHLDPKDILSFSCTTMMGCKLTENRRRGILLARHRARVQLRGVRQHMQARSAFVAAECGGKQLLTRAVCRDQLLEVLERSPDPIADLAAALQQGMALMTLQTRLAPPVADPMRADLLRCANVVVLLAWRQYMNEVRSPAAAAQHPIGPTAGAGPAEQQPEAQPDPEAAAAAAGGQLAVQPATQAAAVQTEGTSLKQLQELLSSLRGVMLSPDNPSRRLSTPSINLLHHLLQQQLQAWNLQP